MTFSDRFNSWLHPIMAKRVVRFYNKKMDLIQRQCPDLFKPVDSDATRRHLALWGKLGLPVGDKWLRFLSNVSGIVDYTYCPDDMYYAVVERVMNICEWGVGGTSDKNMLSMLIDEQDAPRLVLRYMRGRFCDLHYKTLTETEAKAILSADQGILIGKVVDNSGGHGVSAYYYKHGKYVDKNGVELTLERIKSISSSYLIQERIEQCDFSAQFNQASANTCRLITLRCPWSGKTRVTAAGMRFGVTDTVIDNMSQGGICVPVASDGRLGSKAVPNWYGDEPVTKHPMSGVVFGGLVHPYYKKMCEVACKYAERSPYMNILSWDMVADRNGDVRILEVNPAGQGVDWPQFDFGSLFGEDTEDVVDWCARYKKFNTFNHFRTWY